MNMGKKIDLTKGSILKVLLAFMFPILLANLFQQLYNTVDAMIVGYYLGDEALAAMGATASIFELLVGFATGVGSGFGVIIARYVGARDEIKLKQSIASSLVLSTILTILIMLVSSVALKPLMTFLNTPLEIYEQAYSYLYIVCIYVGITVAYNLSGGILRAKGNSLIPLIALFISSGLNVILDIYCIVNLQMGVKGAAVATVISQGVSAGFCILYIYFKEKNLLPNASSFKYNSQMTSDLMGQGLSMGLMLSIVAMGTVILQMAINKSGTAVITGYLAARKAMNFFTMPMMTLATALTTYVSQNLGANDIQRIKKGVSLSNGLIVGWSILSILLVYFISEQFIVIISSTKSSEIIYYGSTYLKISAIFFPALSVLLNLRCTLQGLGQKVIPLFSSIIEFVGKILFVIFLVPHTGFIGICYTEPIIWVFMLLQLLWSYYHCEIFQNH